MLSLLKCWIPAREMSVPILRGPFRGARIRMVPRDNLRKMFGLYEHELNPWLEKVLPRVSTVLDVGGNNGYFAFGCAAAFRRLKKKARIIVFEPLPTHCNEMRATWQERPDDSVEITLCETRVGRTDNTTTTTLDTLAGRVEVLANPTLIKIDVEGAELDVVAGASKWMLPSNYFLIEVHRFEYLAALRATFAAAGLQLEQWYQRPLPLLGREHRTPANWWLISAVN